MAIDTVPAAPEYAEDLLAQQKAALVATWLQGGRAMTTRQVGRELGITESGARYMMQKLSGVLPIYQDGEAGFWRWVG